MAVQKINAIDEFVEAVNLAPELDIVMPQTPEEWDIVSIQEQEYQRDYGRLRWSN